jgi:DNA-binding LytR/AlgR family response regulator
MRKTGKSNAPGPGGDRLLLHLGPGLRQVVEADEVYYVEAADHDTVLRTRSARRLRDVRPMEVLAAAFGRHGFVRIHRNHLVNPRRVRLVRRRPRGEDWEVVLESPVNAVLPVSRDALAALWKALGD